MSRKKFLPAVSIVLVIFGFSFFISACDNSAEESGGAAVNKTRNTDDENGDVGDVDNNPGDQGEIDASNPDIVAIMENDIYDTASAYDKDVRESGDELDITYLGCYKDDSHGLIVIADSSGQPNNVSIEVCDYECNSGLEDSQVDDALEFVGIDPSGLGAVEEYKDSLFYDYSGYNLSVSCDTKYVVTLVSPVEFGE
jgi:hypothetical protein